VKKSIYSDQWGEIIEYTRYRGKGGRFVTEKYGRSKKGKVSPYLKVEREQWRIVEKRRTEKISVQTPDRVLKTTFPGGFAEHEGNIYKTLEDTNIFTQVSKAEKAFFNIRGIDEKGRLVRLQGEITVGDRNQDKQLAVAVSAIINEEGYRIDELYRPDESRNIHARYFKKDWKKNELIRDISVTVTLLR
jgi:hypothetical protein